MFRLRALLYFSPYKIVPWGTVRVTHLARVVRVSIQNRM